MLLTAGSFGSLFLFLTFVVVTGPLSLLGIVGLIFSSLLMLIISISSDLEEDLYDESSFKNVWSKLMHDNLFFSISGFC